MTRPKLAAVASPHMDVEDALCPLQKARALADVMMALTNYTNNAANPSPADKLNPETLHWIAVQQFDVTCEAIDIIQRHVKDWLARRETAS